MCFCLFPPSDELKEKAKQKRLKGSADVQAARRREKEQRLLAEKQSREMEAQEYAADPQAFLANLHRARDSIVQSREERVKSESDSTGRRSVAAKKRASLLAAMGGSGGSIESIEKNARKDRHAFQKEAAFGMRDEDWKIYEDVRMVRGSRASHGTAGDEQRGGAQVAMPASVSVLTQSAFPACVLSSPPPAARRSDAQRQRGRARCHQ